MKKKLLLFTLGVTILTTAGSYSSANALTKEALNEEPVIVISSDEDDEMEAMRARALWEGAKVVGQVANQAFVSGMTAADRVAMWFIGGVQDKNEIESTKDLEILFD